MFKELGETLLEKISGGSKRDINNKSVKIVSKRNVLKRFERVEALSKRKNLKDDDLEQVTGGVNLNNDNLDESDAADSPDNSVNRFKRKSDRGSIIEERRKREHYKIPTVQRIKRNEDSRRRKTR